MILGTEVLCIKGLLIPAELLMQHRETLFQYGFSFEQLGYPPPVQPFERGHWEISIRVTTMWRFAMRSRSSIRVIRFTADAID
jgi:hypothetical protein